MERVFGDCLHVCFTGFWWINRDRINRDSHDFSDFSDIKKVMQS